MLELNRIYNMDCLDGMRQIEDKSVDLIVTSPPYNCGKNYISCSDELPWKEYYSFINLVLDESYRILKDGATVAIVVPPTIKWQFKHQYANTWKDFDSTYKTHRGDEKFTGRGRIESISKTIHTLMENHDPHMRETIIWVKGMENGEPISSNYQMGCDSDPFIRGVYETILIGSKGRWFHSGGTGRRGKDAVPFMDYTKDVWMIPPISSREHPAPFPDEIPRRLIRLYTHGILPVVCDPFSGIGTTALTAIELKRQFIGFEKEKTYFDAAQIRIKKAQEQGKISEWF